jgi:hypothetical protein
VYKPKGYKPKKLREQELEQRLWMPILDAAKFICGVLQGNSNQAIKELKSAVDDGNVKIKRKAPGGNIQTSPDSYWDECWTRLRRQINSIGRSDKGIFEKAARSIDEYCDHPTFVLREDIEREWSAPSLMTPSIKSQKQKLGSQSQKIYDLLNALHPNGWPTDITSKSHVTTVMKEAAKQNIKVTSVDALKRMILRLKHHP